MDPQFLNHFEAELRHLREICAEFAAEHSGPAGRLHLTDDPKHHSRDPYVNMLLQGCAFLSARVRHKMDAEFPRFTQGLLQVLFPHFLCPVPSMAMVGFTPSEGDQTLAKGYTIPRHTLLRGPMVKGERTACLFRTSQAVDLWPIRIMDAAYVSSRRLDELDLPREVKLKSALRLRLRTVGGIKFNQIGGDASRGERILDRLVIHVRDEGKGSEQGPGRIASAILQQVLSRTTAVIIQSGRGSTKMEKVLPGNTVETVGFLGEEALLPVEERSFSGFRLLREYFCLPDRFLFFALTRLSPILKACDTDTVDFVLAFSEDEPLLEEGEIDNRSIVGPDRFALHVTPCINLFEREFDRVTVTPDSHEYEVLADRTVPDDYEVYSLSKVTGYGSEKDERREFLPFFASSDQGAGPSASYMIYRERRTLADKDKQFGRVSDYAGTQTFVSLGDPGRSPLDPAVRELGFRGLCSNRNLPELMPRGVGGTDFTAVDLSGPFQPEIRCLSGPTSPVEAAASDASLWDLIRHLSTNYLSFGEGGGDRAATSLKAAMRMYVDPRRRILKRQIDGLLSLGVSSLVCRMPVKGPIVYGRGIEVSLEFDEEAFAGSGIFILGMVLGEFFSRYVSVNSFSQTVIRSRQRGEIMRRKPDVGWRLPV